MFRVTKTPDLTSNKMIQLSVVELTENVKKLISDALTLDAKHAEGESLLVDKKFQHKFDTDA